MGRKKKSKSINVLASFYKKAFNFAISKTFFLQYFKILEMHTFFNEVDYMTFYEVLWHPYQIIFLLL